MKHLTTADKKEILKLYSEDGYTLSAIAKEFSITPTAVSRIVNPEYRDREKQYSLNYYKTHKEELQKKQKEIYVRRYLKLHKENDKDVISKLNSVSNVNGYLKNLIREDIENE